MNDSATDSLCSRLFLHFKVFLWLACFSDLILHFNYLRHKINIRSASFITQEHPQRHPENSSRWSNSDAHNFTAALPVTFTKPLPPRMWQWKPPTSQAYEPLGCSYTNGISCLASTSRNWSHMISCLEVLTPEWFFFFFCSFSNVVRRGRHGFALCVSRRKRSWIHPYFIKKKSSKKFCCCLRAGCGPWQI